MGLLGAIKATFGIQTREYLVRSIVESYDKYRKELPGKDPHYYLAFAYLTFLQVHEGIDTSNTLMQLEAFEPTYEFACTPYPGCARALGIFLVKKTKYWGGGVTMETIDIRQVEERAVLEKEYESLMAPVYAAKKKKGGLEKLYKKNNPRMPSSRSDWDTSELRGILSSR